jgi:hypothetical protein
LRRPHPARLPAGLSPARRARVRVGIRELAPSRRRDRAAAR